MVDGLFMVTVDGKLETYYHYDDIPQQIDNVIKFIPSIPEGPHTDEEHEMIESLGDMFKELLARETK